MTIITITIIHIHALGVNPKNVLPALLGLIAVSLVTAFAVFSVVFFIASPVLTTPFPTIAAPFSILFPTVSIVLSTLFDISLVSFCICVVFAANENFDITKSKNVQKINE